MRIALAADHAGYELKEALRLKLATQGHALQDFGAHNGERSDYPDFALQAARAVGEGKADRAILMCGSGIGMCISANKIRGVRAAVLRTEEDATLSRSHNDANVACFGSRMTSVDAVERLTNLFLATAFEGGRHADRVRKIES
ncbi:MAG: ribose 5-phosphate isomerase B [Deltaproteobacteria bacterium]|nr:ribose 5-phosphate isomerase B [Deltaproteobacteria bacterium]